ncbi:protein of unknown function [Hyphomicrobium sp. 1Nfss2.1]
MDETPGEQGKRLNYGVALGPISTVTGLRISAPPEPYWRIGDSMTCGRGKPRSRCGGMGFLSDMMPS